MLGLNERTIFKYNIIIVILGQGLNNVEYAKKSLENLTFHYCVI